MKLTSWNPPKLGPREKSQQLAKFLRIPKVKKRHRDRMEDRAARRRKDRLDREKVCQELLDTLGQDPLPRVQNVLIETYLQGQKVEAHKRGTK